MGITRTPQTVAKSQKQFSRTAGDLTINPGNTNWANLPTIGTTWDATLNAAVGDQIEAGLVAVLDSAAVNTFFDVVSIVSSAVVNSLSTGTTPSNSNDGVASWFAPASVSSKAGGSIWYVVQSGDLSSNQITVRLRVREDAATNRNLHAAALFPLQFWARNIGPAV